jgi:flavin reductase (DIM6/NTAB) family NADH-FMN oxidoreductase RutF
MFYETDKGNHGLAIDPFNAIVMPRPIAWISTLSEAGVANLAPYSFFNAFSYAPYYVAFGSGGRKDTMRNIEATMEFAVNLVSFDLREAMNMSSTHQHTDEFELAGLNKATCNLIKSPRVAASPATLECKLFQTIALPADNGSVNDWMVIGRVVGIHIADQFIQNGRVNSTAMHPIVRMGYTEYATVAESWKMRRPNP